MERPPAGPNRLLTLAKVALAVALFALALYTNRAQIGEVASRPIDVSGFAIGFGFFFGGVLLALVRWYLLVAALGLPFRFRDALRLGLIGIFFNVVLPGSVGGEVVRAAYLCRDNPGRRGQAIASAVVDRFLGLAGLFAVALLAGLIGWDRLDPPVRRLVLIAGAALLVIAGLLLIAFTPSLYHRFGSAVRERRRLRHVLSELAIMGTAYRDRAWVVGLGLVLAMLTHLGNVLAFHAVDRALFPTTPSLADHLLMVPLVLVSTGVPLPFGALGVSEQVSAGLFRLADSSNGAVAMMGFRLLQYAAALIGAIVYFGQGARFAALRDMATPPEPVIEPIAAS